MEEALAPMYEGTQPHEHEWRAYNDYHDWCAVPGCKSFKARGSKVPAPQTVEMPAVVQEAKKFMDKVADEQGGGDHKDDGKSMVQLIDPSFLFAVGEVMAFGAKKYAPNNWRKGIHTMRLCGSVLRHVYAWMMREDRDPESKLSHLAHAGASLMMLYMTTKLHPDLDDRP